MSTTEWTSQHLGINHTACRVVLIPSVQADGAHSLGAAVASTGWVNVSVLVKAQRTLVVACFDLNDDVPDG